MATIEKSTEQTQEYGAVVAGETVTDGESYEVRSPYSGDLVAVIHRAGPDDIERAIAAADRAFETTRKLPSWKKEEILDKISAGIAARRDEFARTIALEAGKPMKVARI